MSRSGIKIIDDSIIFGGNMHKKRIFTLLLSVVLTISSLIFISRLCEPKYSDTAAEGNLIGEYYLESDRNREHQVIFLGDCEAYESFVPPILWEEYGITSYVRGSPSQSVVQSYYLLREMLKIEKPHAVVFSVYAMSHERAEREAYNRITLDSMRLSVEKLSAVKESMLEGESFASYIFPLLRFKDRIFELDSSDLKYLFSRPRVSHNGYLLKKGIVSSSEDHTERDGYAQHTIPPKNFIYLDKMLEMCRSEGVELILVKSPTDSWRYPWYTDWNDEISIYAASRGISYYNLIEKIREIGIDGECDSYDGGVHLNVFGAEKTTRYFGSVLFECHGIPSQNDCHKTEEIWSKKLQLYYNERNFSNEK